jgi:hypothetical protein
MEELEQKELGWQSYLEHFASRTVKRTRDHCKSEIAAVKKNISE